MFFRAKPFTLDALDEFLVVGVQGVQGIHQVVLLLVSCRVVQHEQRVEAGDALLGRAPFFPIFWGSSQMTMGRFAAMTSMGLRLLNSSRSSKMMRARLVLGALLHRSR